MPTPQVPTTDWERDSSVDIVTGLRAGARELFVPWSTQNAFGAHTPSVRYYWGLFPLE